MKKSIALIGAGISGLASAALLPHNGFQITIFEKNGVHGGVVGRLSEAGYIAYYFYRNI